MPTGVKIVIICSVIFITWMISSIIIFRKQEKKEWNNGICRKCGGTLEHFCNDSQGGIGVCCNKCGAVYWFNYFRDVDIQQPITEKEDKSEGTTTFEITDLKRFDGFETETIGYGGYVCTECRNAFDKKSYNFRWKYCPFCGKKIKEVEDVVQRFPKDCWNANCPHFHAWDLSIDDMTATCDLLGKQCDMCDEDRSLLTCPLDEPIIKKVSKL